MSHYLVGVFDGSMCLNDTPLPCWLICTMGGEGIGTFIFSVI